MSEANLVSSGIWLNKKFRNLSPASKLVYLFLCCNSKVTVSGIYNINPEFVMFESGIKELDRAEAAFQELEDKCLISFDRNKDMVWIVGKIDFERSYLSEKKYKNVLKQLTLAKGCKFFNEFFLRYPQFIDYEIIIEKSEKKEIQELSNRTSHYRTEQNSTEQ